jgi:hypothetical protein
MQLVISVLNLLGLGGLALFIYFVWKGLRERIANLTALANEQKETLDAVRARATELDQLRKDYRQGLDDFQELGKRIDERRNELVNELETAVQKKDEQLAKTKQLEINQLKLQEDSLALLPQLQDRLTTTLQSLQAQIDILSTLNPSDNNFSFPQTHYETFTEHILRLAGYSLSNSTRQERLLFDSQLNPVRPRLSEPFRPVVGPKRPKNNDPTSES